MIEFMFWIGVFAEADLRMTLLTQGEIPFAYSPLARHIKENT